MRNIVNISLPQTMAQEVRATVKKEGFMSISEFFRSLLRSWMEGRLLVDLEESRKEIETGKGKVLKSLKNLR